MGQFFSKAWESLAGTFFDANQTAIPFGTVPPALQVQTTMALINPRGSGEGGFGWIWARATGTTTGQRFYVDHNAGAPRLAFIGSSSTNNLPLKQFAANSVVYGTWNHVAATWDGTIFASTGIKGYASQNGAPLVALAPGTTVTDGSTAGTNASGSPFVIGNASDFSRTFNGSIAYVARWNRVLSISEMDNVRRYGPLVVPFGLNICWANNRDYGPEKLAPLARAALTPGLSPPRPGILLPYRRQLFHNPAGGSVGTFAGAGSLAGVGAAKKATAATFTGHGTLPAVGASTARAVATLAGHGQLAGVAAAIARSAATLHGAGTLGAVGAALTRAAASYVGHGTLAATGASTARATGTLTGSGALAATGAATARAAAAMSGSGAFSAVGAGSAPGVATATMHGAGALAAVARSTAASTASFGGSGRLIAASPVTQPTGSGGEWPLLIAMLEQSKAKAEAEEEERKRKEADDGAEPVVTTSLTPLKPEPLTAAVARTTLDRLVREPLLDVDHELAEFKELVLMLAEMEGAC